MLQCGTLWGNSFSQMTDNPPHGQARTKQGIEFHFWWHTGETMWKWKCSVISIYRHGHRQYLVFTGNVGSLTWELKELVKPLTSFEFRLSVFHFRRCRTGCTKTETSCIGFSYSSVAAVSLQSLLVRDSSTALTTDSNSRPEATDTYLFLLRIQI